MSDLNTYYQPDDIEIIHTVEVREVSARIWERILQTGHPAHYVTIHRNLTTEEASLKCPEVYTKQDLSDLIEVAKKTLEQLQAWGYTLSPPSSVVNESEVSFADG
jgi:hypothetical protein